MNIVIVSHFFESHRGGVEIVAGQLARAFTLLGHRVVWMACDCNISPEDPAICWRAVGLSANNLLERRTGIPYPVPLPSAARKLDHEIGSADVVLVQDGSYLPCLLALRCARRMGIPVVLMQHIGAVPYRNPLLRLAMIALNRLFTRYALAAADQVVFISELTRQYFATARFQRPPMVLFNGVDASVFAPPPQGSDRAELRRTLSLEPDKVTILFVGRFVEKKGLNHIEQMARRRPDWTWVLAGWGPIDPTSWRLSNVIIFSDRCGRTLAPLYQAADVLVLPSVGEGFPLVIQEALASGLPVVCGSDTAEADPDARRFLTGVKVDPGDPQVTADHFIAGIVPIIEWSGPRCPAQRERAEFARGRYSWERTAGDLLAVFAALKAREIDESHRLSAIVS